MHSTRIVEDCLQCMRAGSELLKLRPRSRAYARRFVLLDDDESGAPAFLAWNSASKPPHRARSTSSPSSSAALISSAATLSSLLPLCRPTHFTTTSLVPVASSWLLVVAVAGHALWGGRAGLQIHSPTHAL